MHAEGRQAWYNVTMQREKAFKICTLSPGVEAWVGLYFVKGQQGGKASFKAASAVMVVRLRTKVELIVSWVALEVDSTMVDTTNKTFGAPQRSWLIRSRIKKRFWGLGSLYDNVVSVPTSRMYQKPICTRDFTS